MDINYDKIIELDINPKINNKTYYIDQLESTKTLLFLTKASNRTKYYNTNQFKISERSDIDKFIYEITKYYNTNIKIKTNEEDITKLKSKLENEKNQKLQKYVDSLIAENKSTESVFDTKIEDLTKELVKLQETWNSYELTPNDIKLWAYNLDGTKSQLQTIVKNIEDNLFTVNGVKNIPPTTELEGKAKNLPVLNSLSKEQIPDLILGLIEYKIKELNKNDQQEEILKTLQEYNKISKEIDEYRKKNEVIKLDELTNDQKKGRREKLERLEKEEQDSLKSNALYSTQESLKREIQKFNDKYPDLQKIGDSESMENSIDSLYTDLSNNNYLPIYTNINIFKKFLYFIKQNKTTDISFDSASKSQDLNKSIEDTHRENLIHNIQLFFKEFFKHKKNLKVKEKDSTVLDYRFISTANKYKIDEDSLEKTKETSKIGDHSEYSINIALDIIEVISNYFINYKLTFTGDIEDVSNYEYKITNSIPDLDQKLLTKGGHVYLPPPISKMSESQDSKQTFIKIYMSDIEALDKKDLEIKDYKEIFFNPALLGKLIDSILDNTFLNTKDRLHDPDSLINNIEVITKVLFDPRQFKGWMGNNNLIYYNKEPYHILSYTLEDKINTTFKKITDDYYLNVKVTLKVINANKKLALGKKIKVSCPERAEYLDEILKEIRINKPIARLQEKLKVSEAEKNEKDVEYYKGLIQHLKKQSTNYYLEPYEKKKYYKKDSDIPLYSQYRFNNLKIKGGKKYTKKLNKKHRKKYSKKHIKKLKKKYTKKHKKKRNNKLSRKKYNYK